MKKKTIGGLYISLSALFFGTYGIWARLMGDSFGEISQAWIRSLIILTVLLPIGISLGQFKKIEQKDIGWYLIITISGALTFVPYFYSFNFLPVGTATLLFYAALTIGTYILGKLAFAEILTFSKVTALFLALLGLGLIFSLSLSLEQTLPALAALTAGLAGSVEIVFTKKLSGNYPALQITFSVFLMGLLTHLPVAIFLNEAIPPIALTIPWIAQLCYAAAQLSAFYFVVKGFRYLEPSIAGLLGLTEVIFAALFGFLFFNEVISISTLVGTCLILLAAALPYITLPLQNKFASH